MNSIFICSLLLLAAAVCNGERIIGGVPTTVSEYPGIVQVEGRNGILWTQICGANILTSRYLLSAAHCFEGLLFNIRSRRIRAGTSNRGSGGVVINPSRAINHPSYGRLNHDGDISVVELSSPLTFSNVIQRVAIVSRGFELPDNLPVTLAGWGAIREGGAGSAVLRHVQVYTVNHETCAARYRNIPRPQVVTENMICAGVLDVGGRDSCNGDSGGPLLFDNILVGIVSWGEGCANAALPGVNTKVSSYTDWIVATAV